MKQFFILQYYQTNELYANLLGEKSICNKKRKTQTGSQNSVIENHKNC